MHSSARTGPKTPSLKDFRRIVVKVGSSLLVDSSASGLKREWLASLVSDIAGLHKDKRDVLVVLSGAIASARSPRCRQARSSRGQQLPPRWDKPRSRERGRRRLVVMA
jgi:hypothetical protein